MENIDYTWKETDIENSKLLEEEIIVSSETQDQEELSTRHNMQIMRRLFHMGNGFAIATLYLVSFSHSQMVHFLGTIACLLYLVEQVRVNYPETAAKLLPFTKFIIRAEEQLKESAMVPFAMAVLLTIITFPKHIALVGIYALAFADPLSAIIGIKYGKHKISPTRSVEGSLAFFIATFISSFVILLGYTGQAGVGIFSVSFLLSMVCTGFDMIPLKIDDNLTIPLFTSAALWTICSLFGVYI